jgi:hypothetical protein
MLPTLKATLSRSRAGISISGRNKLHGSAFPAILQKLFVNFNARLMTIDEKKRTIGAIEGGILNDDTIPQLKASIVAGMANNQLAELRHGRLLIIKGFSTRQTM